MNKQRFEKIQRLGDSINNIWAELESLKDEEEEAYQAMPENLKEGEKGTMLSDNVERISEAMGYLQEVADKLNEIEGGQ